MIARDRSSVRCQPVESAEHGATGKLILHLLRDHETDAELLSLKRGTEVANTRSRVVGISWTQPETAHQPEPKVGPLPCYYRIVKLSHLVSESVGTNY